MERAELVHMGIYCRDVEVLRRFYTEVFGLVVTDEGDTRIGYLVFLSSNPVEHHQLVLVSGRAPDQKSTVNQISFRLKSLTDLREMRDLLAARGVAFRPVDHGIAWSLYIEDPEGNGIEIYVMRPGRSLNPTESLWTWISRTTRSWPRRKPCAAPNPPTRRDANGKTGSA